MSSRRRVSQRQRVAYHEAGHAVTVYLLRLGLKRVTIEPAEDYLGCCWHARLPQSFQPGVSIGAGELRRAVREIMCAVAGGEAEGLLAGRRGKFTGAQEDLARAADFALAVTGSGEEASAYLGWLCIHTRNLLALPHHWHAVQALAVELLARGTVSGRDARDIIRAAIHNAATPLGGCDADAS